MASEERDLTAYTQVHTITNCEVGTTLTGTGFGIVLEPNKDPVQREVSIDSQVKMYINKPTT